MKKHRELVHETHEVSLILQRAYERGYAKGKEEYQVKPTKLVPEYVEGCMQFRCNSCTRAMIANYMFCPYCGRISEEYVSEIEKNESFN